MADKSSSVGVVKYTKQGGTYFVRLLSSFGDIYQRYASYDINTNKASGITPDFTVGGQQPTIEVYVTNSKTTSSAEGSGSVYPTNVVWEVEGVKLTFADNLSTNVFNGESGHFQYVAANPAKGTRAGLKIVKNLVSAFCATTVSIKATATIANGVGSTKIDADYAIPISQDTSNGRYVRISAENGGILDSAHPTCVLTANIDDTGGGSIVNPTYKWEATGDDGVLAVLNGQTSKTLTVTLAMVNNSRLFKVTVSDVGSDVQTVYDNTDELRIEPCPNPVTEDIADSAELKVTWSPALYRGETLVGGTSDKSITWGMNFYSPVGLPIEVATERTITAQEYDANGGANYVITAQV